MQHSKTDTLNIDNKGFKELKRLYKQAVDNTQDQFKFQDKDILTSYAKYLIEYLTPKFTQRHG